MPEPAPIFGAGNSITSVPSHEDVLTPPEDVPSLDSRSFASALDSSYQSSYSQDSIAPSDYTVDTASIEELHEDV